MFSEFLWSETEKNTRGSSDERPNRSTVFKIDRSFSVFFWRQPGRNSRIDTPSTSMIITKERLQQPGTICNRIKIENTGIPGK